MNTEKMQNTQESYEVLLNQPNNYWKIAVTFKMACDNSHACKNC